MQHHAVIKPIRFLPALGMMTAIFIVSSRSGDQLTLPNFLDFDKAWHMLEYGLLAATCLFAFHPCPDHAKTKIALGIILFATLYGISDEFHQSFVPLRTSSIEDVVADFLGAAIVSLLWWRHTSTRHRQLS